MTTLTVDFYTDIGCPWCLIGQKRLDTVLAEQFADLDVEIRHHPVLLMPDCPPEGVNIADMLKARHGIKDLGPVWARVQDEARHSGLSLDMSKQPYAYPSLGGHTLVRLAEARGTQHALAMALREAHFNEARNVSAPDVLADIASKFRFERAEAKRLAQDPVELEKTRREAAQSSAAGVRSVPHFVFDGTVAVSGGVREDALADAIASATGRQ